MHKLKMTKLLELIYTEGCGCYPDCNYNCLIFEGQVSQLEYLKDWKNRARALAYQALMEISPKWRKSHKDRLKNDEYRANILYKAIFSKSQKIEGEKL